MVNDIFVERDLIKSVFIFNLLRVSYFNSNLFLRENMTQATYKITDIDHFNEVDWNWDICTSLGRKVRVSFVTKVDHVQQKVRSPMVYFTVFRHENLKWVRHSEVYLRPIEAERLLEQLPVIRVMAELDNTEHKDVKAAQHPYHCTPLEDQDLCDGFTDVYSNPYRLTRLSYKIYDRKKPGWTTYFQIKQFKTYEQLLKHCQISLRKDELDRLEEDSKAIRYALQNYIHGNPPN